MIKTSISLQELRRKIYLKAKSEKTWRIRRHLMCARKRHGFGWNRWSRDWLYTILGLYNDYQVRYYHA